MPYNPSLLDEQLKKTQRSVTGWPWQLFTFGIIALSLSFFVYLGMRFGYIPYLDSQIKKYDQQIKSYDKTVTEDQKKSLVLFYSQLVNAESLLQSHKISSKLFSSLEKSTHPNVFLTDLSLATVEKSAKITGVASNFDVLSSQLDLFKKMDGVKRVSLDSSQLREGTGVTFSVVLDLDEKIFQLQ